MGWSGAFERLQVVFVRQGKAYIVEALHDALAGEVVHLEGLADVRRGDGELVEFYGDDGLGVIPHGLQQVPDRLFGQVNGEQAVLGRVVLEDVGERGCDHGVEAVVFYRPDRVLAARAGAEVLACEQDHGVFVLFPVHDEFVVLAPAGEEKLPETRAFDALEGIGWNDLVGVHVRVTEGKRCSRDALDGLHQTTSIGTPSSLGEAKRPITAVAAATTGLTRCVLPPLPWRPSKLRLDVDAQRSPGCRMSGFMPRHIEQPALRHSKPALVKTSSNPSSSACFFTRMEPGTTSARMPSLTFFPSRTRAAALKSSIRALVHEPRKTVSTSISLIGVPGFRSMYLKART